MAAAGSRHIWRGRVDSRPGPRWGAGEPRARSCRGERRTRGGSRTGELRARGGRGGEQQARSEAERAALHGGDFCGPDAGEMDRGERRKTKKKLNK